MLEFTDKVVATVTIQKELTEEDIENIMVTAMEGGISYWAGLNNSTEDWNDQPEDEPNSTWATKLLIEGKSVEFYDIEESELDDDESESEKWSLTLEKLIKGYEQNYKERPWDNDIDDGDATTADCIVQYALFGKLVFG